MTGVCMDNQQEISLRAGQASAFSLKHLRSKPPANSKHSWIASQVTRQWPPTPEGHRWSPTTVSCHAPLVLLHVSGSAGSDAPQAELTPSFLLPKTKTIPQVRICQWRKSHPPLALSHNIQYYCARWSWESPVNTASGCSFFCAL